jgi:hypothetical protein
VRTKKNPIDFGLKTDAALVALAGNEISRHEDGDVTSMAYDEQLASFMARGAGGSAERKSSTWPPTGF